MSDYIALAILFLLVMSVVVTARYANRPTPFEAAVRNLDALAIAIGIAFIPPADAMVRAVLAQLDEEWS